MSKPIIKTAALNALAATLYIVAVASLLFYAARAIRGPDTVLIPIFMLLLFVFSAAFTGALVLGRPILWYIDGKKKEALSLFFSTLGFLFFLVLGAFFVLIV